MNSHHTVENLCFHPITQETLLDKLKQIKSKKAGRFDGQSLRLIPAGAATLSRNLLPIINHAISESSFPVGPKKAEVILAFKKDERMNKREI